jgi:hypothetical protein
MSNTDPQQKPGVNSGARYGKQFECCYSHLWYNHMYNKLREQLLDLREQLLDLMEQLLDLREQLLDLRERNNYSIGSNVFFQLFEEISLTVS